MKHLWSLLLVGAATGALAQPAQNARSVVSVGGDNNARVVIDGPIVNRAYGPGAVAETNIAGRRSVVRGDGEVSITIDSTPERPLDLNGDLVNVDLAGRDLAGHRFDQRRIVNTSLAGARLRGASFQGSHLTNVDLSDADLRDADFRGATLVNVDLDGARLDGAHWTDGRTCGNTRCP